MRFRDAVAMIVDSGVEALGPTMWADLGCGDGTFTVALAALVGSGSTIHVIDRDRAALKRIPPAPNGVRITTHHADFTDHPWPFADLDGILMANSLHYVEDQAAFIRRCDDYMKSRGRFLIVEYDTNEASRWVPHPVSRNRLAVLFGSAGYPFVTFLGSRPSAYRRAPLYAAVITSRNLQVT
jgi:ubiquinone/menaquinone biosynthesis C-methylase UbiE